MNLQQLVKMANQIGQFFDVEPDDTLAVQEIHNHLSKFWAPRMRLQLKAALAQGEAGELLPRVQQAVLKLG